MAWTPRITGRAERDFDRMIAWLAERSTEGARRFESAFHDAIDRITASPFAYGLAPENEPVSLGVRQIFFKTPHGKPHRLLYVVEGDIVWVIHIRGPGQNLLTDIVPPPDAGRDE